MAADCSWHIFLIDSCILIKAVNLYRFSLIYLTNCNPPLFIFRIAGCANLSLKAGINGIIMVMMEFKYR